MNIRLFLALVLMLFCSYGQIPSPGGVTSVVFDGPPRDFFTRFYYTSGDYTYTCVTAAQQSAQYTMSLTSTVGGATTSLVFSAGHGFHSDSNPYVTVSGGTGAWAGVNGTWIATYVNSTTVTIPVNSSGFGAVAGTIVVKSKAPRLTQPVWAVWRVKITSGAAVSSIWAADGWNAICSNYATLSYQ